MTDRAPLLPRGRLWAKTRVGRLGLAKLVLLPVHEEQSDGHTHELFATAPNDAVQH